MRDTMRQLELTSSLISFLLVSWAGMGSLHASWIWGRLLCWVAPWFDLLFSCLEIAFIRAWSRVQSLVIMWSKWYISFNRCRLNHRIMSLSWKIFFQWIDLSYHHAWKLIKHFNDVSYYTLLYIISVYSF